MSAATPSTVRPMASERTFTHHREMDEPTIDCWCGADAQLEIQLQSLGESLAWELQLRAARCFAHSLPTLLEDVRDMRPHDRIVLMPL